MLGVGVWYVRRIGVSSCHGLAKWHEREKMGKQFNSQEVFIRLLRHYQDDHALAQFFVLANTGAEITSILVPLSTIQTNAPITSPSVRHQQSYVNYVKTEFPI